MQPSDGHTEKHLRSFFGIGNVERGLGAQLGEVVQQCILARFCRLSIEQPGQRAPAEVFAHDQASQGNRVRAQEMP